ncbi:MAG: bifunctional adenosylcobinamide kinase/adenosylcobinamide-phosphate guanylyltransferase [Clostridia bacterium]|nr:bifunctional adenosylcobinamide kinase/adenosylcobinamide-phosphate guanylyltransferase [Clostridia bacterium]
MILIIGGIAQGKLSYALNTFALKKEDVFYGNVDRLECVFDKKILYDMNAVIKRFYENGIGPIEFILKNIDRFQDKIIIASEIGCGIVPMDKKEREFREIIGRTNCVLAEYAERVDRVFCGIGQTIKGDKH